MELEQVQQVIGQNNQVIMPTHRDLYDSRKYNLPIIPLSDHAVFVKKIPSSIRAGLPLSVNADRQLIADACREFGIYDFLVNFQYARGCTFSNAEMDYMEQVQQVSALKGICMNEQSSNQSDTDFKNQFIAWKNRNTKEIIPVIEQNMDTRLRIKKIAIMKKLGAKKCAVIFRGFNHDTDKTNLSRVLANLRSADIYSIVFGIFPRRWASTGASMLLPSMQFRANAIASWIPWSGGPMKMQFLNSDWKFSDIANSQTGLASYNGQTRKSLVRGSITFNTALSRIDIVNQAGLMARSFVRLPEIKFKSLFN